MRRRERTAERQAGADTQPEAMAGNGAVPGQARMSGRRFAVVAAALVLAVGGAAFGGYKLGAYLDNVSNTCMNSGATVVMHEGPAGECAGVTDGAFAFDPADHALTSIEGKILAENRAVTAHGANYVSVAYLMSIAPDSVQAIHTVTEQLEGAYVEQLRANGQDRFPKVQLLIANDGNQALQYRPVVQQIRNDVGSQHLAAVAGIGVSLGSTLAAVGELTSHDIPVFGSSVTSDDFDNIVNFVRVTPSNRDEVSALLKFAKPRWAKAFFVYDGNSRDSYAETLFSEFRDGWPDSRHVFTTTEHYDTTGDTGSTSPAGMVVANRLSQIAHDICLGQQNIVLFAGRGRELAQLLGDFNDQACLGRSMPLITGDDVTNMPVSAKTLGGLRTGATLYYAGNANPDEWRSAGSPASQAGRRGLAAFNQAFDPRFAAASVRDGNAMMGYDAMLTTVSAITLTDRLEPTPRSVVGELDALQGGNTVLGASGPIILPADYTTKTGSNPVGKAVPILRLNPDNSIGFVALDWPEGQPPAS